MGIVLLILNLYLLVVIARSIFSFFQVREGTAAAKVYDVVYALTEPVLAPIRNRIGPVDFGSMAVDLSPLILTVVIVVLTRLIR